MLVDSMPGQALRANVREAAVSAPELRSVMRHWATGICVVTTASTSLDIWMETDNFSIHVLDQDRGHYVPRFARRGADKVEGLMTHIGSTGAPALPDVTARLDCRLWARCECRDHVILVGV